MSVVLSVTVTFLQEGIELAVEYSHADEPPTPGTKTRTRRAARMARTGLQTALEALGTGPPVWGGFATDTRQSTDRVLVDRERAA